MTPRSDQLTFPQFRRSGATEIALLLREDRFDLIKNSLKGAVKERVNLLAVCEERAKQHMKFMIWLAESNVDDPRTVQDLFKRLCTAQLYVDSVFDSFRDRLHLLRRRVLVSNWRLRCDLVDRMDAGDDITELRVRLRECYRKAISVTAPENAKPLIRVDGFQEEFNAMVRLWVRREIEEIDLQLKDVKTRQLC